MQCTQKSGVKQRGRQAMPVTEDPGIKIANTAYYTIAVTRNTEIPSHGLYGDP